MKLHIAFTLVLISISSVVFPQGGWIKITDPQNSISLYTTIYNYVGASFVDVNNDNLVDIFASIKTLYINQGNGRFVLGSPLNFTFLNGTAGSSWADLDNDGDIDCAIASTPSRVFLNNGTGSFANATNYFQGLANYGAWGCAIGDFNKNSRLSIVFVHALNYHPGSGEEPCKFYFPPDSSSFNFQSVTDYPFTQNLSTYTNPYWSDYDLDGDMDLFIASGPVMGTPALDFCYKNLKVETGNDTLIRMTSELFAQQTQDGQCYNFIDYDNDGDLDLCLTNYFSAPTRFYKNNNGIYTNITTPFTSTTTNIANCWGDYDNDGDLDVVITNDNNPTRYYRNEGNGTFVYLTTGFTTPTATNGVVNGDYDNDGDLDIFTNGVGNNGNTTSVGLYRNDTVAGNRKWINLKLKGTISNTSAIGAIVKIKATINGNSVWQMREVNAQNSFQGQNDLRVHFGLGNATIIDSLIIRWPHGNTQVFTSVNGNKFYSAVEGQGLAEITVGISQIGSSIPENFCLYQNYPNPFNPGTKIKFDVPNTSVSNTTSILAIYDATGREIDVLVNQKLNPGTYEVNWNAVSYASGVYFYKLETSSRIFVKKMILMK